MSNYQSRVQGSGNQQRPQQQTRPSSNHGRQMPPSAGAGNQAPAIILPKQKLFEKFGERFGVDSELLVDTLKKTCFRGQRRDDPPITNEQLVALLIVADQYKLNPFTKEIYAYPDKNGGIVPVVSVDGWIRIIQEHPEFNGMEIRVPEEMITDGTNLEPKFKHKRCWDWIEVTIIRRDREVQTPVVEFFDEVYRAPMWISKDNSGYYVATPWQTHTKRMMRHKGIIQAGRVTFGFAGIYDDDEAERILEAQRDVTPTPRPATHTQAAKDALRERVRPGTTLEGRADPVATQNQDEDPPPFDDDIPIDVTPTPSPAPAPTPTPTEATKDWGALFRAATTLKQLNEIWDDCIAWHDQRGKEIDIGVEAAYQMYEEKLEGK